MDDFDDLDEGSGSGNALLDAEGNTRAGYENFRVQVQVTYSGACCAALWQYVSDSKKVVLTVTQPNGEALDFTCSSRELLKCINLGAFSISDTGSPSIEPKKFEAR